MNEIDPAFLLRRIDAMPDEFVRQLFVDWLLGKTDLTDEQADIVTYEVDARFDSARNVNPATDIS